MSKTTADMIATIRRLKTPEECRNFAQNAKKLGREDLVRECLLRESELLAERKSLSPANDLERRIARDLCLIEKLSGKQLSRTWPMIKRKGFVATVESIVTRPGPSSGFDLAVKHGLPDATFEHVVLDNPTLFSAEATAAARARVGEKK